MFHVFNFHVSVMLLFILILPCFSRTAEAQQYTMEYQAAPIDNPLKGLVPYSNPEQNRFPHSLEFSYIKFSDLVVGPDRYDWQPLEELLDDVTSRGNQTVFRVYLEYPGGESGIPKFLVKQGLRVHRWQHEQDTTIGGKGAIETPDYEDPKLRKTLQQFIAALGEKYDGDPRVGYITAGLLGKWGEWHNYPKDELWASKITQNEVLAAYEDAFDKTPILLRYPAGKDHYAQTPNDKLDFGYHDDSFAYATMDTGKTQDSWFFQKLLSDSGTTEKWKTNPIGGEVRPEVWGCCFDDEPCTPKGQAFARCRDAMHVTWLMETGVFKCQADDKRLANAEREVRKMGYEFFVQSANVQQTVEGAKLTLEIKNTGIAPFYHLGWTIKIRAIDAQQNDWIDTGLELTKILPGSVKKLECRIKMVPNDKFLLGVPNLMPGGKSLRFANKTQDQDQPSWLTIGR